MTSTTTTTTTTATESPATGTAVLPFQPEAMTPAQLAAVSYLARYSGHTHELYAAGSAGAKPNHLDPLGGIQRAHIELDGGSP